MDQEFSQYLNRLPCVLRFGASAQFVLFGCQDKSGVVFGTILLDP